VAFNGSIWVAVGNGNGTALNTIQWSDDGKIWNPITSGGFPTSSGSGFAIAWNGSLWLAGGFLSGSSRLISTQWSKDGKSWNYISAGGFSGGVNGFTWTGTQWLAVGNTLGLGNQTSIQTSPDGKNWFNAASDTFTSIGRGISAGFISSGEGPEGPTGPTGPASTVTGPTGPTGPASTVTGPTGPASIIPTIWSFPSIVFNIVQGTVSSLQSYGPFDFPTSSTTNYTSFSIPVSGTWLMQCNFSLQSIGVDYQNCDISLDLKNNTLSTSQRLHTSQTLAMADTNVLVEHIVAILTDINAGNNYTFRYAYSVKAGFQCKIQLSITNLVMFRLYPTQPTGNAPITGL
jgi:hypothetical protein